MNMNKPFESDGMQDRRSALSQLACGFGAMAFAGLAGNVRGSGVDPMSPRAGVVSY